MPIAIIPLGAVGQVQLNYPGNFREDVVNSLIAQVAQAATSLLTQTGGGIITAMVASYEETSATVTYYRERGRVLREDVIPILAAAKAHQDGRDILKKWGLDSDIRDAALRRLDRQREAKG